MELAPYTMRERGDAPEELVSLLKSFGYRFYHLNGRPIRAGASDFPDIPEGNSLNIIAACW
jgi:hypothetical protein